MQDLKRADYFSYESMSVFNCIPCAQVSLHILGWSSSLITLSGAVKDLKLIRIRGRSGDLLWLPEGRLWRDNLTIELLLLYIYLWVTVSYLLHCPGACFLSRFTLYLLFASQLLVVLEDLHVNMNLCFVMIIFLSA